MREILDQWDFVIGAYAVAIIMLALLIGYGWAAMRRAERRRDELRGKNGRGR